MSLITAKRVWFWVAVSCTEASILALAAYGPPAASKSWLGTILSPFIVPGFMVAWMICGGMSWMDGLTPPWIDKLAAVIVFVVNTALSAVATKALSYFYKEVRPHFGLKDFK